MKLNKKIVSNTLLGIAIGDALGVPVEFVPRKLLKANPVIGMQEYGTHHQPKGTWSDDSSLTFCLAESLCQEYQLNAIAKNFIKWLDENHWTPHNEVFDIGGATSNSLHKIKKGIPPTNSGGLNEMDNGNGSIMRIAPIAFYVKDFEIEKRFQMVKEVSSITHAHIRSVLACFIYTEILHQVLNGEDKRNAYYEAVAIVNDFIKLNPELKKESIHFKRVLNYLLEDIPENEIYSGGYCVHSLEAALWCWLKEESFESIILKAVNLGDDSDTTAAIAGGLAGISSNREEIPQKWIKELVKSKEIILLGNTLQKYLLERK